LFPVLLSKQQQGCQRVVPMSRNQQRAEIGVILQVGNLDKQRLFQQSKDDVPVDDSDSCIADNWSVAGVESDLEHANGVACACVIMHRELIVLCATTGAPQTKMS
jgi:hypothetical protein